MKTTKDIIPSFDTTPAAKGLRFMVVSPIFGGAYPIVHHCHEALTSLGCASDLVDLRHHR